MQVERFVALVHLKRHVVHLVTAIFTENRIWILRRRDWVTGAIAHHDSRMHGVSLLDTGRQKEPAIGLVGLFERLDQYTVTNYDNIF